MIETIISGAVTLICAFGGTIGGMQVYAWRTAQLEKRADNNDKEHAEMNNKISTHDKDIAVIKVKEGL